MGRVWWLNISFEIPRHRAGVVGDLECIYAPLVFCIDTLIYGISAEGCLKHQWCECVSNPMSMHEKEPATAICPKPYATRPPYASLPFLRNIK